MKTKTYILKNFSENLFNDYLCEFEKEKRDKIISKDGNKGSYILVEKMIVKDKAVTSEHYTNIYLINGGQEHELYKIVKDSVVFDYTGFVHPIVHKNKKPMTWSDYQLTFLK